MSTENVTLTDAEKDGYGWDDVPGAGLVFTVDAVEQIIAARVREARAEAQAEALAVVGALVAQAGGTVTVPASALLDDYTVIRSEGPMLDVTFRALKEAGR